MKKYDQVTLQWSRWRRQRLVVDDDGNSGVKEQPTFRMVAVFSMMKSRSLALSSINNCYRGSWLAGCNTYSDSRSVERSRLNEGSEKKHTTIKRWWGRIFGWHSPTGKYNDKRTKAPKPKHVNQVIEYNKSGKIKVTIRWRDDYYVVVVNVRS